MKCRECGGEIDIKRPIPIRTGYAETDIDGYPCKKCGLFYGHEPDGDPEWRPIWTRSGEKVYSLDSII